MEHEKGLIEDIADAAESVAEVVVGKPAESPIPYNSGAGVSDMPMQVWVWRDPAAPSVFHLCIYEGMAPRMASKYLLAV